ncbi:DUF3090 domain-containing protein [Micrococcus endophyticus]|uniref:DUF3090 domain-containing protein n=1 Tax=Micrococcus endophyticus TaxID=455343 RepID=UPI002002AD20|nr:DUF3090 domain-containing protein [Micrococcus endophyticus]MCK6090772.1 DUF3090 domain-containing protein [Micrococcus endophyticus]
MSDAPAHVHEFDWPDRVVIGTIGRPGARTFYLQVRAGSRLMSVALEKEQSAIMAEKIDEILDELMALEGNPHSVPDSTPVELVDNDPLDAVEERFRVGAIGLGWDPSTAQVVVEVHPLVEDEFDQLLQQESEAVLVRMPVGAVRAFTRRTREVVDAGRPMCSDCGHPMDPDGHVCGLPEA